MNVYRQNFATLADALACASTPDASPAWVSANAGMRDSQSGTPRFTETHSYEHAASLAAQGDPDSTARLDALRNRLTAAVASKIQRLDVMHDVYGESLDIGAYCAGVPDPWLRWESTDVAGPQTRFVKIIANICVSGGIPTPIIRNRGAAICALAECLELTGAARVEVSLGWSVAGRAATRGAYGYNAMVLAKPFDAPLEIDRLAFWLCHPSALRRIAFGCFEQITSRAHAEALHYHRTPPCELIDVDRSADGTIYLPSATYGDPQWASEATTEAWVIDTLKAQGVDIRA